MQSARMRRPLPSSNCSRRIILCRSISPRSSVGLRPSRSTSVVATAVSLRNWQRPFRNGITSESKSSAVACSGVAKRRLAWPFATCGFCASKAPTRWNTCCRLARPKLCICFSPIPGRRKNTSAGASCNRPFSSRSIVVLGQDGRFRIATDQESYFKTIRDLISPAAFVEKSPPPDESLPITTFERHFVREGVPIYRLELRKTS